MLPLTSPGAKQHRHQNGRRAALAAGVALLLVLALLNAASFLHSARGRLALTAAALQRHPAAGGGGGATAREQQEQQQQLARPAACPPCVASSAAAAGAIGAAASGASAAAGNATREAEVVRYIQEFALREPELVRSGMGRFEGGGVAGAGWDLSMGRLSSHCRPINSSGNTHNKQTNTQTPPPAARRRRRRRRRRGFLARGAGGARRQFDGVPRARARVPRIARVRGAPRGAGGAQRRPLGPRHRHQRRGVLLPPPSDRAAARAAGRAQLLAAGRALLARAGGDGRGEPRGAQARVCAARGL